MQKLPGEEPQPRERKSTDPGQDKRLQLQSESGTFAGSLALLANELVKEICHGPCADMQGRPMQMVCRGKDHHSLVLSWMETLLYVLDEQQVALSDIRVQVTQTLHLSAHCRARSITGKRLLMPTGVDAASARAVETESGLWQSQCTLLMGLERG